MPYLDPNEGAIFLPTQPTYVACSHCQYPVDVTHHALSMMAEAAAKIALWLREGEEPEHVIAGIGAFHDYVLEMRQNDIDHMAWARRLDRAIFDAAASAKADARRLEATTAAPRRRRRVTP